MEISWLDEPRESPDFTVIRVSSFLFRNNLDTGIAVFANGVKVPQRNSFVLLSSPLNENASDFLFFLPFPFLSFLSAQILFSQKEVKRRRKRKRGRV